MIGELKKSILTGALSFIGFAFVYLVANAAQGKPSDANTIIAGGIGICGGISLSQLIKWGIKTYKSKRTDQS